MASKERELEVKSAIDSVISYLYERDIMLCIAKDKKTDRYALCAVDLPTNKVFRVKNEISNNELN